MFTATKCFVQSLFMHLLPVFTCHFFRKSNPLLQKLQFLKYNGNSPNKVYYQALK